MSGPVIVFDGVWKKFRLGQRHDSLRDLIPATLKALTSRRRATGLKEQEFWALQDVSFEVSPGRALGIIGPNGAGKSTTLKLLTRILRPTRGTSQVLGRVGALIEVAAGFHPDLTGRENVFLQGAVMGMKRAEVAARFDEIVEFAGVSEFIDTQIKRYSSGMNARLGFSIAAHLNPDVLIIDEVLSVGDMSFQERCVERMHAFKRQGVAIAFVSHNLQAVVDLCDTAVYLNRRVESSGPVQDVVSAYVRASAVPADSGAPAEMRIRSVVLRQDGREVSGPVAPGTELSLVAEFEVAFEIQDITFAFLLHRSTDQLTVYDGHFTQTEVGLESIAAGRLAVQFQFRAHLTRGQYYFDLFAWHGPTQRFVTRLRPAGHLTISETRTWGGVADLAVRASGRSLEPRVPVSASQRPAGAGA